jgi:hypothetical protein
MTNDNIGFSTRVNQFVEELMKNTDVISVETVDNVTTITYEDWTEHPPIINTPRERIRLSNGIKGSRQPVSEETREKMKLAQKARTNWLRKPRPSGMKYKKRNEKE